jgi:hypothetical protein
MFSRSLYMLDRRSKNLLETRRVTIKDREISNSRIIKGIESSMKYLHQMYSTVLVLEGIALTFLGTYKHQSQLSSE